MPICGGCRLDGQAFIGVKFDNAALNEVSFKGATLKNVSFLQPTPGTPGLRNITVPSRPYALTVREWIS